MQAIVFVPGIMGSELLLNGEKVWPPTVWEAIASGYTRLEELTDPNLQVGDVVGRVCVDIYGSLLAHLKDLATRTKGLFVPHPYDWRRDLGVLGTDLGATLDRIVDEHGPETEIVLVCHSMGGLVTRGWLERPEAAGTRGVAAARLAVFLATPHEGAPLAIARATGTGGGSVGMSTAGQRQLSAAAGFPAAYQLFPPEWLRPIWQVDGAIPFEDVSAFDPGLVNAEGLSQSHLVEARAFSRILDLACKPAGCRYFAVASGTHRTMTRFDLHHGTLTGVSVPGAGDGTVPIRSATALPVPTAYVDANHIGVAQHPNVFTLLSMLLGAEQPGPVAVSVEQAPPALSISPKFATVGEDYEIVVLAGGAAPFEGEVTLEREQAEGIFVPQKTVPVAAASAGVRMITIVGPALTPGRYRARLLLGSTERAVADLVMMQRPAG